jgi:rsbT co-antagonist protein RsbR
MSGLSVDHLKTKHQLELYGVQQDDIRNIREFGKVVKPEMDTFIDQFYIWLREQPEFSQFFSDEDTLKHVQDLSAEYWHEFFDCELDDDYFIRRQDLGEIHARIGLPLPIYLAAMNFAFQIFTEKIGKAKIAEKDYAASVASVTRLLHLDISIVVATYSEKSNEAIAAQSRLLMQMSTPVTQIWEGVLFLPIVGLIDSKRAQDIMNSSLEKISESRASQFIIDISGVAVVDTAVANYLIKITRATSLMGCTSTISGLSPAIAQTIVELGIDVEGVKTTATMQAALAQAVELIGRQ